MRSNNSKIPIRAILPLNEDPVIYTYAHYSNAVAISQSSSNAQTGDALFSKPHNTFKTLDNGQFDLYCNAEVQVSDIKDEISFDLQTKEGHNEKFCYLYNLVSGDGMYSVCVKFQKLLHLWAEAGILLSKKLPTISYSEDENTARICLNRRPGIRSFIRNLKEQMICDDVEHDYPVWLRISKEKSLVSTYYSDDGRHWTKIDQMNLDLDDQFYIGILVKPCVDTYENWFFTNHIQMHSQKRFDPIEGDVPICFFYGNRKGANYNFNHPFLDIHSIERSMFDKVCCNPLKFFRKAIASGVYVECYLDEYYIPHRTAFKKRHHPHINLIYGYDKYKQTFRVIGYDEKIQYCAYDISAYNVKRAFINVRDNMPTFMIKPTAPEMGYKMNIPLMVQMLKEYRHSQNSHERCALFTQPFKRTYGLEIYRSLLDYLDNAIYDVRIFHMIYEHKKVMCLRLNYLKQHDIIKDELYILLYKNFSEIEQIALKMRNLQIKYRLNDDEAIKKRIAKYINEVYEKEAPALDLLIKALENYSME